MSKVEDILRVRYVAENNFLDVEDLITMLEVTPEDLLERFEDRLYEHKEKFLLEDEYDQLPEKELREAEEAAQQEEE